MVRILVSCNIYEFFLEITDFDFDIPNMKKNALTIEYSILNATKSYRLLFSPSDDPEEKKHININKIKLHYYFLKDNEKSFMKFIKKEKVRVRLLYDNVELGAATYSLKEFGSPYVTKIGMNSLICGVNNQSCYLKCYIGMIGTEN
jgi:hypothetical protein